MNTNFAKLLNRYKLYNKYYINIFITFQLIIYLKYYKKICTINKETISIYTQRN